MRKWPVQEAKARFSEFLDASLKDGGQVVTRRGVEQAVLVPIETWRRLQSGQRSSLKALLLSDEARIDLPAPKRGRRHRRPPVAFV